MEALSLKGSAICMVAFYKKQQSEDVGQLLDQARDIFLQLYSINKELDKDSKCVRFLERYTLVNEQYARFARVVTKSQEEENVEPIPDVELKQAFEELKWPHLVKHLDRSHHVRFPKSYRLFWGEISF